VIFAIIVRLYAKVVIHTVQNAPSYVMAATPAKIVMKYVGTASQPVRDAQRFARAAVCVRSVAAAYAPAVTNAGNVILTFVRNVEVAADALPCARTAGSIALNASICVDTVATVSIVQIYA